MLILLAIFAGLLSLTSLAVQVPCENDKANHWRQQKPLILTDRQQITNSLFNVDVIVDAQDELVSTKILEEGSFEPKSLRAFMQLVKEGQKVMNVGSHIGLQAVTIGQAIGKTGHLYVFEPYKVSYSIVLKNVYLNELQDFSTVINKGCGSKKTIGTMKVDKYNTGGIGLTIGGNTFSAGHNRVEVDTLDNMMPEVQVDLMLMDVQRSETACIDGMKRIIKTSPNLMMYVQWGGEENSHKEAKEQLIWLQEEQGFRFYQHNPYNNGDCDRIVFFQRSIQELMDNRQRGATVDLLMARKHIDPNSYI